jgi:hypothetical protein
MKEKLEQYVNRVKELYEACRDNEAQTKAALIVPLFTILGYDVTDPRECKQEYKADFGEGRGKEPVDWAFCVNDALAFLVEAKAVGKNLPPYDAQLSDYFGKLRPPVRLGILTNGVHWRFFTDLDLLNKMDVQPFLEWDVLKGAIPYEFLTILQRAKFDSEYIKTFAKQRYRQSLLVAQLSTVLKPSPEFVKLALTLPPRTLEDRYLTAPVIEEWTPIFVNAIREWAQQQRLTMALDLVVDDQVEPASIVSLNETGDDQKEPEVSLKDLIDAGILTPGKLTVNYNRTDLEAELLASGVVMFQGQSFKSCSGAGVAAKRSVTGKDMETNGWDFWQYQDKDGNWVPLHVARREYLARKGK